MGKYTCYSRSFSNKNGAKSARDIAMDLGILNSKGKYYSALIGVVICDYIEQNNILYRPVYLCSAKGATKVYPYRIYSQAMKEFIDNNFLDTQEYVSKDMKKYKFKRLIGGIVK